MTRYVPEAQFDETVQEGFWIADFYTDHCGPCKVLDMTLSEVLFDNPEINLVKCDIEKEPAYQKRFKIFGTPTLLFILDGEIKKTISGSQDRATLEEIISEVMFG